MIGQTFSPNPCKQGKNHHYHHHKIADKSERAMFAAQSSLLIWPQVLLMAGGTSSTNNSVHVYGPHYLQTAKPLAGWEFHVFSLIDCSCPVERRRLNAFSFSLLPFLMLFQQFPNSVGFDCLMIIMKIFICIDVACLISHDFIAMIVAQLPEGQEYLEFSQLPVKNQCCMWKLWRQILLFWVC